jgi:hypothetical protein
VLFWSKLDDFDLALLTVEGEFKKQWTSQRGSLYTVSKGKSKILMLMLRGGTEIAGETLKTSHTEKGFFFYRQG